ncbi:flagellar basal body P-ring formation chaperone FlgA [Pandoraea apista]|uniref:flagellar basal body P-ring formation chaperone FlgA n=1 Tax=Pandoraea apista TaxID=93218 RepID=UPI000658F0B8|nr:flagellar basal body P-ring formation chaperone FlgA [Pandoraea apista]APG58101.1 flagella basal body P-ring formation protein FlgA [Pandoraea apista]AVF38792.1 flagellar basal body P-ring formation protein FlgA [Pandoraea apista]RRW96438.1 flagellar basal body P-ring formation protein FlgA [Pandoraea apista]RRX03632.1 flagellar basal body P-ring formation protein FlgA [Pandoraea apista]CFB61753.1 Flagella basal body P-ring formation protein FlgA precursor [Pandoraea apista]
MAGKFGSGLASAPRARHAQRQGLCASVGSGLRVLTVCLSLAGLAVPGFAQAAAPTAAGIATDPAAQNLGSTLGPGAIVIPGNNAVSGGVASNVPSVVRPVTSANANPNGANVGNAGVASVNAQAPQAAAPQNSQFQNTDAIRQTAERFLREQTTGLPGRVAITVGDAVSDRMPACPVLEPFLPPGARLWGSTTVGVRCSGERPWTLYLQARVSINATYFVAARQINPGETIGPNDLSPRQGDLTLLPRTVATDAGQIVGTVAVNRITSGLPIRSDLLRSAIAVQQGQTVRVVSRGSGFEVSTEGQVLSRASAGDPVQVRTRAGQVVSGTVKTGKGGNIEVEVAL